MAYSIRSLASFEKAFAKLPRDDQKRIAEKFERTALLRDRIVKYQTKQ